MEEHDSPVSEALDECRMSVRSSLFLAHRDWRKEIWSKNFIRLLFISPWIFATPFSCTCSSTKSVRHFLLILSVPIALMMRRYIRRTVSIHVAQCRTDATHVVARACCTDYDVLVMVYQSNLTEKKMALEFFIEIK